MRFVGLGVSFDLNGSIRGLHYYVVNDTNFEQMTCCMSVERKCSPNGMLFLNFMGCSVPAVELLFGMIYEAISRCSRHEDRL